MPEYSRGKIYKIVCNETGLIYVGSTCEPTLARRLAKHVKDYRLWKEGKQCFITSYNILEKQNYDIVLLESCPCESKDELHKRERHYIETLECVNKIIVGRSKKEYREENKDNISKNNKIYREENKIKIAEREKEYREENKEKITERKRAYYQEKRDIICKKVMQYREANKEKIKAHKSKVCMCECGREYTNCHKTRHEITNFHQKYLESLKQN